MVLTEDKLRQIVRETIENIINEDIDINVNNNQNPFNKSNTWRTAINEINENGYTFVNIPINNNDILKFKLTKHRLGSIQVDFNNKTKLCMTMAEAFSFIRRCTGNILTTLNKNNLNNNR